MVKRFQFYKKCVHCGLNDFFSYFNEVIRFDLHIILMMEEILHQLVGSLSHHLQGFTNRRWCRISQPSIIPWKSKDHWNNRFSPKTIFVVGNLNHPTFRTIILIVFDFHLTSREYFLNDRIEITNRLIVNCWFGVGGLDMKGILLWKGTPSHWAPKHQNSSPVEIHGTYIFIIIYLHLP